MDARRAIARAKLQYPFEAEFETGASALPASVVALVASREDGQKLGWTCTVPRHLDVVPQF